MLLHDFFCIFTFLLQSELTNGIRAAGLGSSCSMGLNIRIVELETGRL